MFWFKGRKPEGGREKIECFHCGARIERGAAVMSDFDGTPQPFCCNGCAAVFKLMISLGHADHDRLRHHRAAR